MRTQIVVAGALVLLAGGRLSAQEFKFQPPNLFEQKKLPPKSPPVDWNARPPTELRRAETKVVCGMTVVQADPKIDQTFSVKPPNNGTTYTLKVVEPAVCKSQR